MLDSLIKIENFIERESPLVLPSNLVVFDWDFAKSLHKALEPIAVLTKKMQSLHYVIGDFVRDLGDCLKRLAENTNNRHSATLRIKLMDRQLVQYNCPAVLAALFVDPRYHTNDGPQVLTSVQQDIAIVSTQSNIEILFVLN